MQQRRQGVLAGRVNEQSLDVVEELVANGPRHGPVAQPLSGVQDLLDPHPRGAGRGQALEVAGGVGEPVGMVDPQPVDDAVGQQRQHLGMGQLEDLGILDTDAREVVDVEEAAVVAGLRIDVEDANALVRIGPPAVLVAGPHVVGDDVENDLQPCLRQRPQAILAAQGLRDRRRIDDVVAVRRARPRRQRRRQVQVADAEIGQVGNERADIVEAQVRPELEAIGRAEVTHAAGLPGAAPSRTAP